MGRERERTRGRDVYINRELEEKRKTERERKRERQWKKMRNEKMEFLKRQIRIEKKYGIRE